MVCQVVCQAVCQGMEWEGRDLHLDGAPPSTIIGLPNMAGCLDMAGYLSMAGQALHKWVEE